MLIAPIYHENEQLLQAMRDNGESVVFCCFKDAAGEMQFLYPNGEVPECAGFEEEVLRMLPAGEIADASAGNKVQMYTCSHCGHQWLEFSLGSEPPAVCPSCVKPLKKKGSSGPLFRLL